MLAVILVGLGVWLVVTIAAIIMIPGRKQAKEEQAFVSTCFCPSSHKALSIDCRECHKCKRRLTCAVAQSE